MPHYRTIVCLPPGTVPRDVHDLCEKVLAPFDEDLKMEPYRRYIEGDVSSIWYLKGLRENGHDLPEDGLTWEQVAIAHNAEYSDGEDDYEHMFVGEDGRTR